MADAQARARKSQPRRWASPLDMASALDKTVVRTPALELINKSLVALADGTETRLLVAVSPQEGKSTLCSKWYPLWKLVDDPSCRVAVVSYSDEMARRWGSDIKQLVESFDGTDDTTDLGIRLRGDSRAAGRWQIEGQTGGVYCVGISGSLTGKPVDCLRGDTQILTEYGYASIREICGSAATLPRVLSYNNKTGRTEWRRIVATRAIPDRPITEIRTVAGRVLHCTPDHRIYTVDRGYVSAAEIQPGTRLVVADRGDMPMRSLREGVHEGPVGSVAHEAGRPAPLLTKVPVRCCDTDLDVRGLRHGVHPTAVRGREGEAERVPPIVLHENVFPCDRVHRGGSGPAVRSVRSASPGPTPEVPLLLQGVRAGTTTGGRNLRPLRHRLSASPVRVGEEASSGTTSVLLTSVCSRGVQGRRSAVSQVREANRIEGPGSSVLRQGMPTGSQPCGQDADCMPAVRQAVLAEGFSTSVLRSSVCQCGALDSNDWCGQLEIQGRDQLRRVVQANASLDLRTGRESLSRLRSAGSDGGDETQERLGDSVQIGVGRASHRPRPEGQSSREPDPVVSALSYGAPQVSHDTVSVVQELRGTRDTVYDIQVDGNCNFFADEVLVHNCLIIDDPIKDLSAAQSEAYRKRCRDFWQGVAVPRLGPGAKCLLVQTRWHEDDMAGWLLASDGEGDRSKGGRWQVVSIPAQAESDDDPLGRKTGEFMQSARGNRDWDAIRKSVGSYVWASLYQQRPAPAEGGLFRRLHWRYWSQAPSHGGGERIDLAGRIFDLRDCWKFLTGDLAASTRTSADWTVAAAWALSLDGDLVLLDYNRAKVGEANHYDLFRPLAQRWRVDTAFVEATQHSMTLTAEATRSGLHITPLKADADKFSRALPYSARVSAGRVWLPAGSTKLDAWVSEHAGFPAATHDDLVDVGAYAVRVAITKWAPPPASPRVRTHRDELFDVPDPFGSSVVTDFLSVDF